MTCTSIRRTTNHVLLATDRGGVLASDDGGVFVSRRTMDFRRGRSRLTSADAPQPATIYVGVVNDKDWGGVFVSDNGGLSWTQKSAGLNGHDVFSLGQASDGTVLAEPGMGFIGCTDEIWSRVDDVSLNEGRRSGSAPAADPPCREKKAAVVHKRAEQAPSQWLPRRPRRRRAAAHSMRM